MGYADILSTEPNLRLVLWLFLLGLLACTFQLCCYIIGGYGLYYLARDRSIARPWLAWVPVARFYLLGQTGGRFLPYPKLRLLLKWGLLLLATLALLSGWQGLLQSLSSGLGSILSASQFIRLVLGTSPSHALIRLVCLLFSLCALYPIVAEYQPQKAFLLCAFCIPFWPLRWILLWLCHRWEQQRQRTPEQPGLSTQEWLSALAQAENKQPPNNSL